MTFKSTYTYLFIQVDFVVNILHPIYSIIGILDFSWYVQKDMRL